MPPTGKASGDAFNSWTRSICSSVRPVLASTREATRCPKVLEFIGRGEWIRTIDLFPFKTDTVFPTFKTN